MQETDAFQDMRNTLLMVRVLSRLQDERAKNRFLDQMLCEVERENGYSSPVHLINQSTFLAMLYSTALWLREAYFKGDNATVLKEYVKPFIANRDIEIKYGECTKHINEQNAEQFARHLRNALAHASVKLSEDRFVFIDQNPRNENDWVSIKMPWPVAGEYTMALIRAGNVLLYSQPSDSADD